MLAGWSFGFSSASAKDCAEQPGEGNTLMAQVGRLLNLGMQESGNWGNGTSVDSDCVLVKMSVKNREPGMQGDAGRPQARRRKEQESSSSHSSKDDQCYL